MIQIKNILKGIIIGIANIIPGVSGGILAISMGVYDVIIDALAHLPQQLKKSIRTLFPFAIGAFIGIITLSFIMEYLFLYYPLPTYFCFIGLILGGLMKILKNIPFSKLTLSHYLLFFSAFIITFALPYLNHSTLQTNLSFSLESFIKLLMIGFIISATMIIPGISGSIILMILGYYQPLLHIINQSITYLLAFDFIHLIENILFLFPLAVGVIIGIFSLAKLIKICLSRYKSYTYCAILGLVLSSIFSLILLLPFKNLTINTSIPCMITLLIGLCLASIFKE